MEKSKSKAAWLLGRPQQVDQAALSQKATEITRAQEVCPRRQHVQSSSKILFRFRGLWLLFLRSASP